MEHRSNAYKVIMIFPKKYPSGNPVMASVWNAMTTELRELEGEFTEIEAGGEWRGEKDDSCLYFFGSSPKTVMGLRGLSSMS